MKKYLIMLITALTMLSCNKQEVYDSPTDDLNYSNLTVIMNINNFDDITKDVLLE